MNVVDSCGWIEYFTAGPNAALFARPIRDVGELLVPTVCIYEVYRATLRKRGDEEALEAAGAMRRGRVVDLDLDTAINAADLSIERRLPALDSFILATARTHSATLWTQDEHFKGLDGVEFVEAR